MVRAAALCASLLFALPTVASAQDAPTVAIMAVGGTIGLTATAWTEATEAIEARLREAGFRIDDSGLPRRDDCTSVTCLREERAARDVDLLVTLTIFAAEGGDGAPGSVVVAMVDADGRYVGQEGVDGRVIGVVAALALATARSERERGPEPWVRVAGTPVGAIVRIDGREVGVVPYEGRIEAGDHQIEVSLGGHETMTRRFTARSGSTETIDVALAARAATGGVDLAWATVGGVAIAGSIGMFVHALAYDLSEGACIDALCTGGYGHDSFDEVLYGLSAGTLAIGVTLLVVAFSN